MVLDKSSPKSIFWGLFDLLQEDLSTVLSKGFNESRRLKDSSVLTWPNSATESNNRVAIASESTEVLFSRPFKSSSIVKDKTLETLTSESCNTATRKSRWRLKHFNFAEMGTFTFGTKRFVQFAGVLYFSNISALIYTQICVELFVHNFGYLLWDRRPKTIRGSKGVIYQV